MCFRSTEVVTLEVIEEQSHLYVTIKINLILIQINLKSKHDTSSLEYLF